MSSLTSLELIDKLAALVPPPRIHRHRYYGVLAPNSPFRASVTAMAGQSLAQGAIEMQTTDKNDEPVTREQENKSKRSLNRYLWAKLPRPAHAPYLHPCRQCFLPESITCFLYYVQNVEQKCKS